MPRKNVLTPFPVINAQSMGASITSAATNIQYLDNIGVQFNFTGTPTGTFSIEVSNDHTQDTAGGNSVTNAGNWIAVTLNPVPAASGAAGNVFIDLNQLGAPWIRLKYTRTSGTGTLSAYIGGKEV